MYSSCVLRGGKVQMKTVMMITLYNSLSERPVLALTSTWTCWGTVQWLCSLLVHKL